MVESEVVVTAKELKADRERRERETEDREREEKEAKEKVEEKGLDDAEKGGGSDRASGDTEVLGGEEKADAIEKEGKEDEEVESDCVEIPNESVKEKGTVERVEGRRKRFSKRLAKVIASGEVKVKVDKMDIDPSSEDDEEEEEEIPLKMRTRAGRATAQVAPAAEKPEESSTTTPSTEVVPQNPRELTYSDHTTS